MRSKVLDSVRLAFPRFLWGILGTWFVIGPFILLTGSGYESWGIALLLLLLVVLCYFVVLVICLRRKWESLKKLVSETGLALCFIIIGLVIQEMTGTFLEIKDEIAIVYALIGFLIAELVTPNGPMKALRALLTSVIRHRLHFLVGL